jgi:hypothetical protein
MDDQVGPDAAQVGEDVGQQADGGARKPVHQRDRRRRIGERLVAPGVEAHRRAGAFDLVLERGRGVVCDGVAAPDKLSHDRQRRVDAPVHGDVEERDGTHRPTPARRKPMPGPHWPMSPEARRPDRGRAR